MLLKNKKLALFCALPHHTRFLYPFAEAAKKEGADILFFTSLVDYPYEMEIEKKNFRVKLLPEYADAKTRGKINNATKELYQDWAKMNFKWHGFRHWSIFQQHRALTRNVEDYFCMEEMIKQEEPDMFVALHEMNPWGKQIGHLSYKYKIPFVTFQEGDYYNTLINLTTHTEYSVCNLLWGNDTRHRLLLHKCSESKIVIIGNTYLDEIIKTYTKPSTIKQIKKELKIPANKKVLLLMLNTFWGAIDDKSLWRELLQGLKRPDIFVILKWHPQVPYHIYQNISKIIKGILPDALIFFSENPYKIIAVSHYCVVMGKTTLGVEALAFGKPLFDLFNIEGGEEFYKESGIAQSVSPLGNWEALFNTIRNGVPKDIEVAANDYLTHVFYTQDGQATARALNIIDFILTHKGQTDRNYIDKDVFDNTQIGSSCRVSFIIVGGKNPDLLNITLYSLKKHAPKNDVQFIIVLSDKSAMEQVDAHLENQIVVEGKNMYQVALANKGAHAANGNYLVFITAGMYYYKDDGFIDSIDGAISGMPIYNPDLTPYCLGMGVDFNFTPYQIKDHGKKIVGISSFLFGVDRNVFADLGGFDEEIAFSSIDLCLLAKEKGYPVKFLEDCITFLYKTEHLNAPNTNKSEYDYNTWQRKIKFFARWCGNLERDDDYLTFAHKFLNQQVVYPNPEEADKKANAAKP